PLFCAQRAHAVMRDQPEGGSIVNIASVSGMRPSPRTAAYGAAKAGLINLTQTLAMEWAPKVRVNCVTGGLIETEQSELFYVDVVVARRQAGDGEDVGVGRGVPPHEGRRAPDDDRVAPDRRSAVVGRLLPPRADGVGAGRPEDRSRRARRGQARCGVAGMAGG